MSAMKSEGRGRATRCLTRFLGATICASPRCSCAPPSFLVSILCLRSIVRASAAYYHRRASGTAKSIVNPLSNCGLPFRAVEHGSCSIHHAALHPAAAPWSLCLFSLLHLYRGGNVFLARRWTGSNFAAAFAGIVFSFNGLTLHCLMCRTTRRPWARPGWVVARARRRGGGVVATGGLASACQFRRRAEAFSDVGRARREFGAGRHGSCHF
jgi:hypothetical protein